MNHLVSYIVFTMVFPVALLIIFLEKRARRVMLSFLCGTLVCFAAYSLNTQIYRSLRITTSSYAQVFGPVVEEILKFIPLLLFCLLLRKGKRQTIAMAFALGVGFCLTENLFYMITNIDTVNASWIFIRSIGTGLMHSMSAVFMGYGLYKARTDERKYGVLIGIVALLVAMIYHAAFNILVSSESLKLVGIFMPMLSYFMVSLLLKKDAILAFFDDDIIQEKSEGK